MKILHTADWHAGRSLHGRDRTPEVRDVLGEIAELAATEAVDLIVVAGDLFDTKNPSAEAERAVYDFFLATGRAGIPTVAIAGNHDSGARIDAVAEMLRLTDTTAIGTVRVAGQGGAFDLRIGDETARIAALPFVSERRIVKAIELLDEELGAQRSSYRDRMRKLVANLAAGFSGETVNLLLLHTTFEGARLANSEYRFHASETYTVGADLVPTSVNYAALGHIHRAQSIGGLSEHQGRYCGSPLQLDFGEQGDPKYVYIVEARPGKPTETLLEHRVEAGRRLKQVRLAPDELEGRTPELAAWEGWLKLRVDLPEPRPGLKERIHDALPNVLSVETLLPEIDPDPDADAVDLDRIDVLEAYRRYVEETRGDALPDELETAFRELWEAQLEERA